MMITARSFPFPMPNDVMPDGRTVVASCYYRDMNEDERMEGDDWPLTVHLVLLLGPTAPFFTVAHIDGDGVILNSEDHFNIVFAVEAYQEWGGDV